MSLRTSPGVASRDSQMVARFVFVEMGRREAKGLEKHNPVPDAPTLLQFVTVRCYDLLSSVANVVNIH